MVFILNVLKFTIGRCFMSHDYGLGLPKDENDPVKFFNELKNLFISNDQPRTEIEQGITAKVTISAGRVFTGIAKERGIKLNHVTNDIYEKWKSLTPEQLNKITKDDVKTMHNTIRSIQSLDNISIDKTEGLKDTTFFDKTFFNPVKIFYSIFRPVFTYSRNKKLNEIIDDLTQIEQQKGFQIKNSPSRVDRAPQRESDSSGPMQSVEDWLRDIPKSKSNESGSTIEVPVSQAEKNLQELKKMEQGAKNLENRGQSLFDTATKLSQEQKKTEKFFPTFLWFIVCRIQKKGGDLLTVGFTELFIPVV